MSELRATLLAPLLRGLEKLLPVPAYLALIYPVAFVRAVIHQLYKRPKPLALPPFVAPSRRWRLLRLPMYLNRTFEFIPDRLSSAKWQARCHYVGFDAVFKALSEGTPVLFVFAHFGPFLLLRSWLRAAGISTQIISIRAESNLSPLQQQKNQWAASAGILPALHPRQLGDAVRMFKNGDTLAMAFDVRHKNEVIVPLPDGGNYAVATGAIRLARKHRAMLFPCIIYNTGLWRYCVTAAPPVPADIIHDGDVAAAQDILDKLLPIIKERPAQWNVEMMGQFEPSPTHPNDASKSDSPTS